MPTSPLRPFDDPWVPPRDKEQIEASKTCWRIQNIPSNWTKEMLEFQLESLHDGENLELDWIALYPAVSSTTQTALLCFKAPPLWLQGLKPDEAYPIEIGEADKVYLRIDRHFYGLTPLNTPSGDKITDIIAVTGFGGHAFGSWRSRKSHRMWLMDFLPVDLPKNVRVMAYGYDSGIRASQEKTILEFTGEFLQNLMNARTSLGEGCRPIIFIGHSLGCSIIGQLDPEVTPSVGKYFLPLALSSSLDRFRPNSRYLEELRESLIPVLEKPGFNVISFSEKEKTPVVVQDHSGAWIRNGSQVEIVTRMSSYLFIPCEIRYPADGDHSGMVKFMNPTDVTYLTVIRHIKDVLREYAAERLHS